MKKILCLLMSAVLAVMMMAPMKASANSGYVEGSDLGPASVLDYYGANFYSTWDYYEQRSFGDGTVYAVDAWKDYTHYISIDIRDLWAQSGYLPYYTLDISIGARFNGSFNMPRFSTLNLSVADVSVVGGPIEGLQVSSAMPNVYFRNNTDSSLVQSLETDFDGMYIRVNVAEPRRVSTDGSDVCTLAVTYRLSFSASDVANSGVSFDLPSYVSVNTLVAPWGSTCFYSYSKLEQYFNWLGTKVDTLGQYVGVKLDALGQSVVGSIGTLQSNIGSWFSTQWEKMSGFTDRIVDAITGSGGGENIGTAQEEMNTHFEQIEEVEQQLSDQISDKVEVPTLSLASDETSGLKWVVTTINALYVSFDELHVMFACVVFFGIIAVLLFGRRNL